MATRAQFGNAGFKRTVGGVTTTHALGAPLRDLQPIAVQRRVSRESLDYSALDVVLIGGGLHDLVGTIRYDNEPAALRAMLVDGANGASLTYYPDLADPLTSYPFRLVQVEGQSGDEVPIKPDRDRKAYGEWEVTVRLRRLDGGSIDDLL